MTDLDQNIPEAEGKGAALWRVFIAVPLPDEALAQFLVVMKNLQKGAQFTPCPLRWIKPSGLHVTLHFMGAQSPEKIEAIKGAMDTVAGKGAPLLMEIKQFGVFPHWRSPSVLWAGVRDRGRRMARLHADLAEALAPLGYASEAREFHPHLTLARFKGLRGAGAFEKIVMGQPAYRIGPFESTQCGLYRSRTLAEGAEYDLLHKIELCGAAPGGAEQDEAGAEK